jgi:hypothetical protein
MVSKQIKLHVQGLLKGLEQQRETSLAYGQFSYGDGSNPTVGDAIEFCKSLLASGVTDYPPEKPAEPKPLPDKTSKAESMGPSGRQHKGR